jgi:hypothetical protein
MVSGQADVEDGGVVHIPARVGWGQVCSEGRCVTHRIQVRDLWALYNGFPYLCPMSVTPPYQFPSCPALATFVQPAPMDGMVSGWGPVHVLPSPP